MGETFAGIASSGPLLLAIGVAAAAGLVSFLSPCCLPLMPGYLSYVTGLAGSELSDAVVTGSDTDGTVAVATKAEVSRRARVVVGSVLFVVGFSVVFVSEGLLFGGLGSLLTGHRVAIERVLGIVTIVMRLAFLGLGLVPGLERDVRIHRMPATGL